MRRHSAHGRNLHAHFASREQLEHDKVLLRVLKIVDKADDVRLPLTLACKSNLKQISYVFH